LNKNKEISLTLSLIKDLDPFFFEFLIDIVGNSDNTLFTENSNLTNYLKNLIFLNILSTEIITNDLDQKLTESRTIDNLIYSTNKQLNSSKLSNKDIKYELEKIFFYSLKKIKHNYFLTSETSNLIKKLKNYILI